MLTALNFDGTLPFKYPAVAAADALHARRSPPPAAGKKGAAVSPLVAQKMARLQTIVAERSAWEKSLTQVKRMQQGVLDVEHILDGSWAKPGERLSNARVRAPFRWLAQELGWARDLRHAHSTRAGVSAAVPGRVLSNLWPHLMQCDNREAFPRTVPRHAAPYSPPQDALSTREWSEKLE